MSLGAHPRRARNETALRSPVGRTQTPDIAVQIDAPFPVEIPSVDTKSWRAPRSPYEESESPVRSPLIVPHRRRHPAER